MKNSALKFSVVLSSVALALAWAQFIARAQGRAPSRTASDFSTSEYFDAPNEKQPRFIVTGAEAQPQPGALYLIKKLKIETFRVTGEREVVVEAPECLYDSAKGQASSSGHLQVQSGDGRFSVAGEGFLWQQGPGSLTISNQIRSVIRRTFTNAATSPPLVVTSRWFSFQMTNRSAVFHKDVRGEDTEMEFTCGELRVRAAPGSQSHEGQSFEVIEAEPSLVIVGKVDGRRAMSDRGIYTRSDERVELTGNVNWQQGRQSGRADRAVVKRLEHDVVTEGRVAMKLPRESLGAGGQMLSGTNPPAATGNLPLVDLFADRFHSRSNLTMVEGGVRLVDGTNQLACDKLTVQSTTGAAADETATAEGNVVLKQGGGIMRASRAVYTRSEATIIFTGQPEWTQAQIEGQAEHVTIHTETGEIHAEGQVAVKVPMVAETTSFLTLFPAATGTNSGSQAVEVFAQEFTAKDRRAIFVGDVRARQLPVTGGEPRLRSEELEAKFATASNHIESLQARQNVVYEQGMRGVTNGPAVFRKLSTRTLTATSDATTGALSNLVARGDVQFEQPGCVAKGGQAIFSVATDVLELTDSPVLETPRAVTTARTLFWDVAHNRAWGIDYKIVPKPEMMKEAAGILRNP